MTTILRETKGGGGTGKRGGARRCDATCHKAKEPRCSCICGGRYHGSGSSSSAHSMLVRDVADGTLGEELRNGELGLV